MYYYSLLEGKGEYPNAGDTIIVKYVGSLLDGTIFDASDRKDEPFKFVLGQYLVLPGWEEGIPMMSKGGKAKMLLPSDLAFGDQNLRNIPPYSTLLFEIEILDIIPGN